MKIQTRDFGQMEIDETQVLEFVSPIYGFEALSRYVLLSDEETGSGLMWLQSVEDSKVCFILLDPEEIGLEYTPEISSDMAHLLKIKQAPALRLVAVVPENFKETTVNLKSPIVINQTQKLAAQVVLDADYPVRLRLFDSEEAAGC